MYKGKNGRYKEEELVELEAMSLMYEIVRNWVNDLISFLKEWENKPPLHFAERIAEETGISLDRVFNYLYLRWDDILDDVSEIFDEAEIFIEERREEEKEEFEGEEKESDSF